MVQHKSFLKEKHGGEYEKKKIKNDDSKIYCKNNDSIP